MVLTGHGAESTDLPEEPFQHRLALTQVGRHEATRFLRKIDQDGARFKDGHGLPAV
jgi:hypothetical protein